MKTATDPSPPSSASEAAAGSVRRYEFKAVTLLSLGFGIIGVDRCVIAPMFPAIMKEFNLNYTDLGHILAVTSIAWGVSAVFIGRLSDRIGPRKVAIATLLLFSLLICCHGLVAGIGGLIMLRGLMGAVEGAFLPASIVATIEASDLRRQGRNVGIQQAALPLFGLALGPVVATQLLQVTSWWVILTGLAIPGLIVTALMYRVLRDPDADALKSHTATHDVDSHSWREIFRYRNVPLAMVCMFALQGSIIVMVAMLPNYFVKDLHLSIPKMGMVLSALGLGGVCGAFVLALSDRFGRKPVLIVNLTVGLLCVALLLPAGPNPLKLFVLLLGASCSVFGAITMAVGPLSTESVPARLATAASGMVIGPAEIFGGGIMPIVAGIIAQKFGLYYTLYLALAGLLISLLAVLPMEETAPGRRKDLNPDREVADIGGKSTATLLKTK